MCVWGIYPQSMVLKSHLSHNEFLEHTKQTKSVTNTNFVFTFHFYFGLGFLPLKVSTFYDVKDLYEYFHVCDFVNVNNVGQ